MSTLHFNTFDIKLEESIKFLREIVSINSHSYNKIGVDFTQDIIASKLSSYGLLVDFHDDPDFGKHLIARTPVSSNERILLVGHTDTVHPANGDFQDFSIDNTDAFGPGVLDMKGSIAMMQLACSLLGERLLEIPLTILIVSDEEIGCPSSKNLHYELAKEAKYALVLEFGRDKETIITSRKGIASFRIQVKGKSSHSGNHYYEGINAIQEAARMVMELQDVSSKEKATTLNVGIISGGTAINTVPDFAEINTDLRFISQDGYHYGKNEIEKITSRNFLPGTEILLQEMNFMPAMPRNPGTETLIQDFFEIGKLHGIHFTENQTPAGGASSGNLLADAGLVVLDAIGPTGSGAHSNEEKMNLTSFANRAKVLAEFLDRSW